MKHTWKPKRPAFTNFDHARLEILRVIPIAVRFDGTQLSDLGRRQHLLKAIMLAAVAVRDAPAMRIQFPAYWRTRTEFSPELAKSDRVFCQQGLVVSTPGCEVLAECVLPYFNRDAVRYCSHLQTPPREEASGQPVIVAGDRFVYFADPIFREYRQSGNIAARDARRLAMHRLIGPAVFGEGLAPTIQIYPRRRRDDLILTLLHYIPIRKALNIDMIEERSTFAGEILRLPKNANSVQVFGMGEKLPREIDGGWSLPAKSRGRVPLVASGFFDNIGLR